MENIIIFSFKICAIIIWISILIAVSLKVYAVSKEERRGSNFMIEYKHGGLNEYLNLLFFTVINIVYTTILLSLIYGTYKFITIEMF